MDVVLIILGTLGLGAIIVSAYVFTIAARNYVSDDTKHRGKGTSSSPTKRWIMRNSTDRRSDRPVAFPLNVNGVLIPEDRRHQPDRRHAA